MISIQINELLATLVISINIIFKKFLLLIHFCSLSDKVAYLYNGQNDASTISQELQCGLFKIKKKENLNLSKFTAF